MKKIFPLVASLLLLSACSTNNPATTSSDTSKEPESTTTSTPATKSILTFLNDGEMYIDINFQNKPEGLSFKVGETTLTASGKVTMNKDFTFEIGGTFTQAANIYYVIDSGIGSAGVGKSEGYDAEGVKPLLERYFNNFSSKQYGYRVYFCVSDQPSGWSKTLPGVDESIRSYGG